MTDPLHQFLGEALAYCLPGNASHVSMEPPLCYGRQKGPAPIDARQAGVLVLLDYNAGDVQALLIQRSDTLQEHPGQIGFPGGGTKAGETWVDAAVREAEEEIGMDFNAVEVMGCLTPLYVHRSRNLMFPVLALAHKRQGFVTDQGEVQRVFWVTRRELREGKGVFDNIGYPWKSLPVPAFAVSQGKIWGATAMVLAEVLEILADFTG